MGAFSAVGLRLAGREQEHSFAYLHQRCPPGLLRRGQIAQRKAGQARILQVSCSTFINSASQPVIMKLAKLSVPYFFRYMTLL